MGTLVWSASFGKVSVIGTAAVVVVRTYFVPQSYAATHAVMCTYVHVRSKTTKVATIIVPCGF